MKARTVVGRGEERARYVTPDLSYYWEGGREKCEDNKWDEKETKKNTHTYDICGFSFYPLTSSTPELYLVGHPEQGGTRTSSIGHTHSRCRVSVLQAHGPRYYNAGTRVSGQHTYCI